MKKQDFLSSQQRSTRLSQDDHKCPKKSKKIRKISEKIQHKLCRSLSRYISSNAFNEREIESLKLNLYCAGQRTREQLETELSSNRIEYTESTKKWELISRVAHGRTFGKIIKKCPTCRAGQLQLELDEGRYICQLDSHSSFALSSMNPVGSASMNCGLAFDFAEIDHLQWINNSSRTGCISI